MREWNIKEATICMHAEKESDYMDEWVWNILKVSRKWTLRFVCACDTHCIGNQRSFGWKMWISKKHTHTLALIKIKVILSIELFSQKKKHLNVLLFRCKPWIRMPKNELEAQTNDWPKRMPKQKANFEWIAKLCLNKVHYLNGLKAPTWAT